MLRSVRWVVAVAAVVAAFGLCLWLARSVSFGWMPQGEADRWVVATAFATVAAGAVGVATGWWAGQEDAPSVDRRAQPLPDGSQDQPGDGDPSAAAPPGLPPVGDHVDFSGGTFHAPVLGKGEQKNSSGRDSA